MEQQYGPIFLVMDSANKSTNPKIISAIRMNQKLLEAYGILIEF
jgi:hypothetical protein